MKTPHDSSDIASLIWADWHEEFGDQEYSDEIRLSVQEPNVNSWCYEYRRGGGIGGIAVESDIVGGLGIGSLVGGGGWGEIGGAFGGGSVGIRPLVGQPGIRGQPGISGVGSLRQQSENYT